MQGRQRNCFAIQFLKLRKAGWKEECWKGFFLIGIQRLCVTGWSDSILADMLDPCWFLEKCFSVLCLVLRKKCLCEKEESEWGFIGMVGFDGDMIVI